MKITLVTGNKFKADETIEILNTPVDTSEIELEEIQGLDLEKVALHKLEQAYELLKKNVMIDDVSLEVEVWNGFPGPLIKWLLKVGNGPKILLKMLEGEKNRRAIAKLAVGFHDGKKPHLFFGQATGTIAYEIRGDNGFGWDKVFIPTGYRETFAEMDNELKNSISHRGNALRKFKDFLKSRYGI